MSIIEVNNLTKEYRLGDLQGLKQTLLNTGARLMGRKIPKRPLFKALDDISFSVEEGEVVGIIGHNGAGKSTLLKMLARISTPTSGILRVNGHIAPLIEVGAGFVPNFTGRENVYLNGNILGLSRREIKNKFDEIVDFAEMEEFIDTPVKRYSTGMQVKLAFAVATSIESEILIVDEVLAVGDLAFQRKCFDRMEDIIKRQNRTVLLVSHNLRQVERLCSRAIMLNHGVVAYDDKPDIVCNKFYEYSNDRSLNALSSDNRPNSSIKGSGEIRLTSLEILDSNGLVTDKITTNDDLWVRLRLTCNSKINQPEIVIGTHTTDFFYITGNSTAALSGRPDFIPGAHEILYKAPSFPLAPGIYCLRVAIFDSVRRLIYAGETLKIFSITPDQDEGKQPPLRTINTKCEWSFNTPDPQ